MACVRPAMRGLSETILPLSVGVAQLRFEIRPIRRDKAPDLEGRPIVQERNRGGRVGRKLRDDGPQLPAQRVILIVRLGSGDWPMSAA